MTETKTRQRTPYHVFQELEKGVWKQLTEEPDTLAISRKDAIAKASHGVDANGAKFLAIKEQEVKPTDQPKLKGTNKTKLLEEEIAALRAKLVEAGDLPQE